MPLIVKPFILYLKKVVQMMQSHQFANLKPMLINTNESSE